MSCKASATPSLHRPTLVFLCHVSLITREKYAQRAQSDGRSPSILLVFVSLIEVVA